MDFSPEILKFIESIGVPGFLGVIVFVMFRRQAAALAKQSEITAERAKQMDDERVKDKEEIDKQIERAEARAARAAELAINVLKDQVAQQGKTIAEQGKTIATQTNDISSIRTERDKIKYDLDATTRRLNEVEEKMRLAAREAEKEIRFRDEVIAKQSANETELAEKANRLELEKKELLEKMRQLEIQLTELNARVAGLEAADGIKTDKLRKIETGLLVDPAAKKDAA